MDRRKRDAWIVFFLGTVGLGLAFWLNPSQDVGSGRGLFYVVLGCLVLIAGGIWLLRTPPKRIL